MEKYFNQFPDLQLREDESTFDHFKRAVEYQTEVRYYIRGILQETHDQMYSKRRVPITGRDRSQPQNIGRFLRPANEKGEFNIEQVGLPEGLPFDAYIFFRNFYNPDLEGFLDLDLHQYHILFQLLEHELRLMETDMQGIDLKFVLLTALTSSNMSKFLLQMHGTKFLPLVHPNGYRQVMFMDYTNHYGAGCTTLYLHTSPHKQYYVRVADSMKDWLRDHYSKLKNKQYLLQKDNISYFVNVKNMPAEGYENGSVSNQEGIELTTQGKFEMLQSSIYPPSYGVPSELFFIIKIQIEAMESLDRRVILKSIHLTIKDKTYNKRTGKMEVINVEINRDLSKKVEGEAVPRKIILEKGGIGEKRESNVLLYVENLGAQVNGYLKYHYEGDAEVRQIKINKFNLDLPKGQYLIPNQLFKEFWDAHAEFERRRKTHGYETNVNMQEQVERHVQGEDERQALRMQEMMQQMLQQQQE